MSVDLHPPAFTFVIDTDSYAGNFERELCAYLTGCIGECKVGHTTAQVAQKELGPWYNHSGDPNTFPDLVVQVADERGCTRPTSIGVTPGYWNDGRGGHYPDEDWESDSRRKKILADMKARMREDAERYKNGPNHRFYEEGMKKAEEATLDGKYPAYQSVEIFLYKHPGEELLRLMMDRAHAFAQKPSKFSGSFKIHGFRLVRRTLHEEDVGSWPS